MAYLGRNRNERRRKKSFAVEPSTPTHEIQFIEKLKHTNAHRDDEKPSWKFGASLSHSLYVQVPKICECKCHCHDNRHKERNENSFVSCTKFIHFEVHTHHTHTLTTFLSSAWAIAVKQTFIANESRICYSFCFVSNYFHRRSALHKTEWEQKQEHSNKSSKFANSPLHPGVQSNSPISSCANTFCMWNSSFQSTENPFSCDVVVNKTPI